MPDPKSDSTIIAKLHDLLKLTADNQSHWCPENLLEAGKVKEANPGLWKALKHHCVFRSWQHACSVDLDRETFCISLADHKASAISRRLRRIHASREVYRVWRDEPSEYGDPIAVPGVVEYISEPRDPEEILRKFESDLGKRPETVGKRDGSSFTSLLTHGELTAAWASFFLSNADAYGIPERGDRLWQMLKGANGRALLDREVLLLRCKIRTHGRLARLRDLQIVRESEDIKNQVTDALDGALLYNLPDEALIVAHPGMLPELETRLQGFLTTSHYVEYADAETALRGTKGKKQGFLHNFDRLFRGYPRVAHPVLTDPIVPDHGNPASSHAIICDLCQLAPASVQFPQDVYPDETDPVNEYLCKECAELRKRSTTKAKKLTTWERALDETEDEEENGRTKARPRVCLVKVSLDMDELVGVLKTSFEQTFPDALNPGQLNNQDLGFSVLHEFIVDYTKFVEDFRKAVLVLGNGRYDGDNHDKILDGFMALRIEKDFEVADITREYVKLYDKYFPRLKGPTFPVKLSVSCSHIKHPFLEHWDVLDSPTSAINVQSVRRAQVGLSFEQFEALESFGKNPERHVSSFLHSLAEIYDRTGSELLVKFALLEKQNNERKVVAPFMNGIVDPKQILNYYKLFVQDAKR